MIEAAGADSPRAIEMFDAFVPRLPASLVPAGAVLALRAATQRLPRVSGMGLELHLGTEQPRTDLCLRLRRNELQLPAETGRRDASALAGTAFCQPGWRPIRDLLSAWAAADPAQGALSGVENIGVELDLGTAYQMESAPSLFFDIDRAGRLSVAEQLAACDVVLRLLQREPEPAARQQLARCLELGLPALRLYYLGLMFSRNSEAFRVCLIGRRADAILPYLDRIGWSGERERIAELLTRYASAADKLILDLDVSSRPHDSLGIEIFFDTPRKWPEFFSRLENDGLCRPEEARALLGWPGRSRRADGRGENLIRRINHVKLAYHPSQPLRAKAYLYLCASSTRCDA